MTKKPRKSQLWEFDPSLFQTGPRAPLIERYLLAPARSLAGRTLYALAFAYPVLLVSLGVIFGGLVFWASLGVSFLVVWIVLKKTGYARNFANWDIGYMKFLGLFASFGITLAFVYSLAYTPIKLMTIPIMMGILVVVLVVGVWIKSKRFTF